MKYLKVLNQKNKTSNLFSDNEESVLDNKPVQFLDKFIFKQLGEKNSLFLTIEIVNKE